MDLRHLRYFVAVAEELHFGRAAERLNMSQPPLSQQIKELEEQLQATLFRRTSRSVELTVAGRMVLDRARHILADADELKSVARRAQRGEVGEIVVGFINSAGYSILPPVIRRFRSEYSDVVVHLREYRGTELTEHLKRRRIDVAFARRLPTTPQIRTEVILREPFVLALPEEHPALDLPVLSLAALSEENFVNFPRADAPAYHEAIVRLCTAAGFVPRITHETSTIHAAFVFVRAGFGVAIVPASAMQIQTKGVIFRKPVENSVTAEMVLAWRSDADSPAISRFVETARAGASSYQREQTPLWHS